jgi:hypothetical protein
MPVHHWTCLCEIEAVLSLFPSPAESLMQGCHDNLYSVYHMVYMFLCSLGLSSTGEKPAEWHVPIMTIPYREK